jgi:hypothetical protein
MPFSDEVARQAFENSGGQCQCRKRNHPHFYIPCGKPLTWDKRGKPGWGGWEANRVDTMRGDDLVNCEIVCYSCKDKSF